MIHCDLKIANICLHRDPDRILPPKLKIIDFGLSHEMKDGQAILNHRCGTKGYMAPEIVNSKEEVDRGGKGILITSAVDMWAFGVLMYELCVAYFPTRIQPMFGRRDIPIFSVFPESEWSFRSQNLIDLIVQCLAFEAVMRISASEALRHCWF